MSSNSRQSTVDVALVHVKAERKRNKHRPCSRREFQVIVALGAADNKEKTTIVYERSLLQAMAAHHAAAVN